jgi:hypothetical protein
VMGAAQEVLRQTQRITLTLPSASIARIDRVEHNCSRFITDAVERELARQLRAELRRSLKAPHPEVLELAELRLGAYRKELPPELSDLVAPGAGVAVAWFEGEGWRPTEDR